MTKKVLIISPYFPPANTPDMQRIRMSLPYFIQYGWEAEVVAVDFAYTDVQKDDLLIKTVAPGIKIHKIKALNKKWTSKLGFGNIAFRSYWFYRKKVNNLLRSKQFDLIYFSTTQFPICILGTYWKKRFNLPYIIDIQDPWHSDYYQNKPKQQQPSKYWFSYRLNKYLEQMAMKHVDGLISVSEKYINDIKNRYPQLKSVPSSIITFGYLKTDVDIAIKNKGAFINLLQPGFKNIVYVGRGGMDLYSAVNPVFKTLKQGLLKQPELYSQLKFYFIGTSYAPKGEGIASILPLAKQLGVESSVIEITDRISYFHALVTLQNANALFIPGSDAAGYTASKIYPYLLIQKPILAIFNSKSPALRVLNECGVKYAYSYDTEINIEKHLLNYLDAVINDNNTLPHNEDCIEKYNAENMTKLQCDLFNRVLSEIR